MNGANITDFKGTQWTANNQFVNVGKNDITKGDHDTNLSELHTKMSINAVHLVEAMRNGELDAKDLKHQLHLVSKNKHTKK